MKIKLPNELGNLQEVNVDKDSLQRFFHNTLTRTDTAEVRWFTCAFCNAVKFFPLESDDYLICNNCWAESIGEEE